ncbi:MAG: heme-copper oxidase subunit III [bacterium]
MSDTAAVAGDDRYEDFPVPSNRMGMWWFLASEVVTFGGLFASFLLLSITNGGWQGQASHNLFWIGTINTYILLTSSLTVVLAHHSAETQDVGSTLKWIGLTLLLGVVFLGLKAYEYYEHIHHGVVPSTNLFFGFYYTMTGLHALHVIGGLGAWLWTAKRVAVDDSLSAVAPVGLYWHFVDLVWIFLYPLMYTI